MRASEAAVQKCLNSIWKAQLGVADYIRNTELELQRKEQQEEKWSVRLGSLAKACSRISKVYISQIMMSLFTPTSSQRSEETFPKVLNKLARSVGECTKCEESTAGTTTEREKNGGGRGHNEHLMKLTSRLCFSSFTFFLYIICMYFSTNRETCDQTGGKVSAWMWWNREKSPNRTSWSLFFLFFRCYSTVYCPPMS